MLFFIYVIISLEFKQIDQICFVTNNERIYDFCLEKILKKTDPEITFSDAECCQLRLTIETINEKDKTKPIPKNQQNVMPINDVFKVGSFVKKWNNKKEGDDVKLVFFFHFIKLTFVL